MSINDQGSVEQQPTTEQNSESTDQSQVSESKQLQDSPSITELDKLEKFRFNGMDLTPKELSQQMLRHSDYTRKSQEIAEERKYYDNLHHDLDAVKTNPSLANKFREVYPEKYHRYLNYVSSVSPEQAKGNGSQQDKMQLPPEIMSRFEKIDKFESYLREQEVKAAEAELTNMIEPLKKKYDLVDEEAALARAEALLKQGVDLNASTWEKIFKGLHDKSEQMWKARQSAEVQKQKEAGRRGADVGSGGGIPGGKPQIPRTIKEATKMALESVNRD